MSKTGDLSGCTQLEQLENSIAECLARDVPLLLRQLGGLQGRCRRGQPIDRGLPALQARVEQSLQRVALRRRQAPKPRYALQLPVVEQRQTILESIAQHQVVILCGETGSGKTTQLPKLCLELGRGCQGKIGHTQPRRIAARSLATRIAEELDSRVGEAVGYKVRFQDQVRPTSYIKIMTDGILLAEIQSDPELREYDTLILDEAHERSLNIDFLLGYLHQLLPRRPDLKLIITSATINPERFSQHFGDAPIIEVSGRTWPVETRYRPLQGDDEEQQDRSRGQALLDAVDELAQQGRGDILVFLPGERAIRDASELLRKHHPPQTEILPLYARLSPAQQSQVFREHGGRRIVLATNVAETSLTVPGIHYVVDTGLARLSRYNYRTKIQRLPIEAISRASANQRAGRCGRVAAGVCVRLYSEEDFLARAEFTEPEIQRTNLAAVILQMATLGLGSVEDFPFVDAPDPRLVADGYKLLHELGAVDMQRRIMSLGREIGRLPLDPRLARMILAARDLHCLTEVLVIAAALEIADPRDRPLDQAQAADQKHAPFRDEKSDFITYLNLWNAFREQARHLSQNKLRKWCREHFLSYMRMREWQDVHTQLITQVTAMGMRRNDMEADYRAIHCALLTGLLGNLAFLTEPREYLGARNLKFTLFPGSGVRKKQPKWLVASELVETGRRYLRTVAAIEPEWVEPLAQHLVKHSYSEPHWEKKRGQVVASERVTLYGLPLVSGRKINYGPVDPVMARDLFIRHALIAGEFHTRAAFVQHNRALLEELEQLECKSRRRDLVADEEALYAFFDERIPAEIYDGRRFEIWWKKLPSAERAGLQLRREHIMRHAAEDITETQFPDYMEIRGVRLPLSYHFKPGEPDDGLWVHLPLAALNQFSAGDFDWLVPGLLKEKITLMIKSLPKQLRRHFVPVPDYAEACLQAMTLREGVLPEVLAAQLQRMSGVSIPPDAWQLEQLPDHAHAHFELLDEGGRQLAVGRDLEQLQARFGTRARQDFSSATQPGLERDNIENWDFGVLPESVEVVRGGMTLRGYPALTVGDGHIALRLFDDAAVAKHEHQQGLLALFRRQAGRTVKEIRRAVPDLPRQVMCFSTVAGADVLQADLETAVLRAAFLADGADIREPDLFRSRLEQGRAHIPELARQIGTSSLSALDSYQRLQRELKGAVTLQMIDAIEDVRTQVGMLVYPGFIAATPAHWLPHVGRYIEAAIQRLKKLPASPQRDREHAAIVRRQWSAYQQAATKHPDAPALLELRWMTEELRVSLFAQELGTSAKVSPERLDRLREEAGRTPQARPQMAAGGKRS